MTFGQFIKQKRQQSKLSQQSLATACGFKHRSAILRLEQDRLEWKLKEIMSIAELFGLSASQLLAEYENFKVNVIKVV